jgi:hypothetical protein
MFLPMRSIARFAFSDAIKNEKPQLAGLHRSEVKLHDTNVGNYIKLALSHSLAQLP